MKLTRGERVFATANYIALSLLTLVIVLPFWYVISVSVTPYSVFSEKDGMILFPTSFSFQYYEYLLQKGSLIYASYGNTLRNTAGGVLLALFLTATAAYALAEKKLPGRRIIILYFVFTLLFKGGLIPTYITVKDLGQLNTNYVLILIMAFSAFNMILMKSFFENIPESLRESAWIDGASEFRILWTIVLPVSMNGLELIEAAQARKPDIRCIILSGLSEFEHARQAIKLRVRDYVLKPIDPAEIERVLERIVRELGEEREEREQREEPDRPARAAELDLPNLSRLLHPGELIGNLKKKKLVEQAVQYMKDHYARRELALSDVAAEVGLSEKYVNQLVKEVTGSTINHLLIRFRMEEAARLLKEPANRIYEICEAIGYADQDHFRESFKRQYGLTPTEYRNRHL